MAHDAKSGQDKHVRLRYWCRGRDSESIALFLEGVMTPMIRTKQEVNMRERVNIG